MVELIRASTRPIEFNQWLDLLDKSGSRYKVVINDGYIMRVNVITVDDGQWDSVEYGAIEGAGGIRFKEKVYQPALVEGKFTINYNGKRHKGYAKARVK